MQRSTILILIIVLLTTLGGYFVSWPSYQDWQLQKSQLQKADTTLKNLKQQQGLIDTLKAAEPTLSTKATNALTLIPTDESRDPFVTEIDALAKATGVNLVTFTFSGPINQSKKKAAASSTVNETTDTTENAASPAPAVPAPNPSVSAKPGVIVPGLGFTATVIGDYPAITSFVSQLRTTSRYNSLTSINITASEAGTNAALEGIIYNVPAPKIPAGQKFDQSVWNYLDRQTAQSPALPAIPGAGRPNPFVNY